MNFIKGENGQAALEYTLLFAFVVLVVIVAIPPLRESVFSVINKANLILKTDSTP